MNYLSCRHINTKQNNLHSQVKDSIPSVIMFCESKSDALSVKFHFPHKYLDLLLCLAIHAQAC